MVGSRPAGSRGAGKLRQALVAAAAQLRAAIGICSRTAKASSQNPWPSGDICRRWMAKAANCRCNVSRSVAQCSRRAASVIVARGVRLPRQERRSGAAAQCVCKSVAIILIAHSPKCRSSSFRWRAPAHRGPRSRSSSPGRRAAASRSRRSGESCRRAGQLDADACAVR